VTIPATPLAEPSSRSRYPGTQPFGDSPEDQARFFGRDAEAEQLYLRVLSVPLLVQFGRSGLGKTSLLQAGLFPRLRRKPFLPAMIRLNDTHDSLTAAVTRSLQEACEAEGIEFVPGDTSSLWRLLATTAIWRDDLLLTPVLVFDQFEEVFTLRDAELRRTIAAELGAIASAKPGSAPAVKIVISLREDYLGALEEFSAAIPGLFHERLRLEAMSQDAARAAITGPARLEAGPHDLPYESPRFELDRPALDAMVQYLQGSSGVIEPFQLQLLCGHAEEIAARKKTEPVTLTLDDFRGAQRFASVLQNFYRGTLGEISPPSQRRKAAALCEEGLLDAAGHRLMLHEGQILADYGVKPRTLAMLCDTRLVRTERRLESTFYEISHDRLAESIIAARQGRMPKKVRRLLWATAAAAVIVVGLLLLWNESVDRARDSAEDLLTFLLGEEFLGEIRDTGRSSMLEKVRNKVAGSEAGRSPLNHALALRHQADMTRIGNDLPHALAFQRRALAIFKDLGLERELARSHGRVARNLSEQGQITEASIEYELAIQSWDRVTAAADAATADCIDLAETLTAAGLVNETAGKGDRAREHLDRAVGIASNVLFGGKGRCAEKWGSIDPFPDAGAVAVLSDVSLTRSRGGLAVPNLDGIVTMADDARKLQPQSVTARQNALFALRTRGLLSAPAAGVDDLTKVLAGLDQLGRWDPQNQLWAGDRAIVQVSLAGVIAKCYTPQETPCPSPPPLENARAMTLEALTTLRTLSEADPSNVLFSDGVVSALMAYAQVVSVAGDQPEALTRLLEAERVWNARRRDPADSLPRLKLGEILQQQAEVLALMKRNTEAAQTLQRAIVVIEPLQRQQPHNLRYIAGLVAARIHESALRTVLGDVPGATAAAAELTRLKTAEETANRPTLEKQVSLSADDFELIQKVGDSMYSKEFAEALPMLAVQEEQEREMIALFPTEFGSYSTIRNTYMNMAEAQKALGQSAGELASLAAAMNAAQVAAWLAPEQDREARNVVLLDARNDVADALFDRKRSAEALEVIRENVVLAEEMAQRRECIECRWMLGVAKCLYAFGQRDISADGLRSGLIHLESASKESNNGKILGDLAHWRLVLADELEKSGSQPEANALRRLALATYANVPPAYLTDEQKADIARTRKMNL
jgi:tetratricopeptide (TPR) repeat protein